MECPDWPCCRSPLGNCLYILCCLLSLLDTLRLKISSVRISDSLDSATVTWNAPSAYAQVTVTGYDIWIVPHLKDTLHTTSATMHYCRGQTTSCTVSQSLMAETLYTFQVRARTSVGTSPWSTPVVTSSTLSLG